MTFEEKTIKSKMIYEGKIINLRVDEVETVSGKPSSREIVEHDGGVAVAAFTDEKKLIMVRQYRKAAGEVLLEVPAGKQEKGELPEITAIRELKEETGYTAKKIEKLATLYASPGYCQELLHLFLCTDMTCGDTEFDESEAIEIAAYAIPELIEMIASGEIKDAKTVAAIFLAKQRLAQRGIL